MRQVRMYSDFTCDTPSCPSQVLDQTAPGIPAGWIMVNVTDSDGVQGATRHFCNTCARAAYAAVEQDIPIPGSEPAPAEEPPAEPPAEEPV